ncbi:HNH endonuclease [bacterium]|nr:HNH endonuclease [bacterium]
MRRNLTDIPATRKLNSIFMDIIESIGNEKGEKLIRSIISQLIDVSASDESFETSLGGQIYTDNAGVVRFILCYLEEENMTKESWVNLWKMEKKRYVWTIEHIFPQGENIPPSWVEMIAGGNEQKAIELRESHVHKLGNLTISGFNSTLGNKSFKEKRDRRDRKGRYVGYLNGLHLNKDLADRNSWKTSDIDDRTATLKEIVLELFKLR